MLNDTQKYDIEQSISLDFNNDCFFSNDSLKNEIKKILTAITTVNTESYRGDYEILNRIFHNPKLLYNLEKANIESVTVGQIKSHILDYIYNQLDNLAKLLNVSINNEFDLHELKNTYVTPFIDTEFVSHSLTNKDVADLGFQMDTKGLDEAQTLGIEMGLTREQVLSENFDGYNTIIMLNQALENNKKTASEIFADIFENQKQVVLEPANYEHINEVNPEYYTNLGFTLEQSEYIIAIPNGMDQVNDMLSIGMDPENIYTALLG